MKKVLLLFLVVLNTVLVVAQRSGTISGTIIDREMQEAPLPFANVALKNTLWSAQTDFYGNFYFTDVPPGNYTLAITYLGYETLEVPLEVKARETTSILQSLSALTMGSKGIALSEAKIGPLASEMADDNVGGLR